MSDDAPFTNWTLDSLTQVLGVHYADWKFAEKEKNRYKDEFFERATAACAEREPEEKLVEVGHPMMSEADAVRLVEMYHPRFMVDAIRVVSEGYEAIMVERPEFMSFTFVNVRDGLVYSRQVVDGPQLLDDARLANEDPDLYEEVTFLLPWGTRMVIPLDTLTPKQLARVADYIYRGKPSVKLAAPRKAKDEELESVAA